MAIDSVFSRLRLRLNGEWPRLFGEARTRILMWYIGVILVFIGAAIPTIRYRILSQVERRVQADLREEMTEFKELLTDGPIYADESVVQQLRKEKEKIPNGYPTSREELSSLYEIYLARRIPEDDIFLIAFLDGELYKSSPRALPEVLEPHTKLMRTWASLQKPQQGTERVEDPRIGGLLHSAEPIRYEGKTLGTFVVVHTTAGEQNEALEAFNSVVQVKVLLLMMALGLIWFAAGRVLSPIRTLSETAHSISETDLSKRIPARGNGEIAELAQTFNDMMDRLQGSFESQRNFISDAGHELRTPITIIRGHLELMGSDPEEQRETIELVVDELDRMARMVDELSLLAKAERPDFLKLEIVDIEPFTKELYAKASALSVDRDWQLAEVATGSLLADRQRLTEAIINLAQNAVQHTAPGARITLGSALRSSALQLWVSDTGTGIADADQSRIFERFARSARQRRPSEGTGLGLAIVKAIAEAHHGQVTLRSHLGTGSTFTLVLPLEPTSGLH
jgi:signal transduction histidine kinase